MSYRFSSKRLVIKMYRTSIQDINVYFQCLTKAHEQGYA